jgi:hypothetical protein
VGKGANTGPGRKRGGCAVSERRLNVAEGTILALTLLAAMMIIDRLTR